MSSLYIFLGSRNFINDILYENNEKKKKGIIN